MKIFPIDSKIILHLNALLRIQKSIITRDAFKIVVDIMQCIQGCRCHPLKNNRKRKVFPMMIKTVNQIEKKRVWMNLRRNRLKIRTLLCIDISSQSIPMRILQIFCNQVLKKKSGAIDMILKLFSKQMRNICRAGKVLYKIKIKL